MAGVAVVGAVAAVVLSQGGGHGGDGGSGGSGSSGGSGGKSSGSPSVPAAGALPAAWAGTWTGEGPGSAVQGTEDIEVTLTLHTGATVGRQVSSVRLAGSGSEAGCTEDLQLTRAEGSVMVFRAVTSTPTDPDSGLRCDTGAVYSLSMADADHLRIGTGSQALGSPATLEKKD